VCRDRIFASACAGARAGDASAVGLSHQPSGAALHRSHAEARAHSAKAFTQAQVTDGFNPPDWHPDGHPAMPEIVGHGRRPDIRACGYCHLPNGQGRPENSNLAGLSAAYIVAQVADMRDGLRKSSEPSMGPPAAMLNLAKASNDAEVKIAAEYFSKLKYKPWIKVVEAKMVPKTKIVTGMLVPIEGGGMEPLGERIVETAQSLEPTEARDDASPFVAYVPVGSLKKGEALVTTGVPGHRRRGQNSALLHLSRPGSQGSWRRAVSRRQVAQLFGAPALRHQERIAKGPLEPADERSRRQFDDRGYGEHRRLRLLTHALRANALSR
jgi:cytochrome c553